MIGQLDWIEFVKKARLAIYMDRMGSVGRFPRDCAALRIPCALSARSDFGGRVGEECERDLLLWRVQDPDYRVEKVCESIEWLDTNWDAAAYVQRQVLMSEAGPDVCRNRFERACEALSFA